MPLGWTLAKFLIKVVAPSVPEIVSTVATLKTQHQQAQAREQAEKASVEHRLTELEKTVITQLQLIEQLTAQLQSLHHSLIIALRLAIGGFVLAVVALGVLLLR